MQAIIDFFKAISDGISSALGFLLSFIQDTIYVIKLTGEFVSQIPTYLGWLPSSVLAIVVTVFTIVVIYKVLGREG